MNAPVPHTQVADAAPIQAPDRVGWADINDLQVAIRTAVLERRVRELEAAVSYCPNCGGSPCRTEAFCRTCSEVDQRRESDSPELLRARRLLGVTIDRAWAELNSPQRAAASTVEALAYQLRGGVKALRDPSALRRIAELSEPQMREIAQRLTKRVPPWQPDEIEPLIQIWSKRNVSNHY